MYACPCITHTHLARFSIMNVILTHLPTKSTYLAGNKPYPSSPAIYSVVERTMCSLYRRIRKFPNDIKIYLLINYVKCAPIFICTQARAHATQKEKYMVWLYRTIFAMFWTFNFTYNSYKSYYVRVSIKHEAWVRLYTDTHTHMYILCFVHRSKLKIRSAWRMSIHVRVE